MIRVARGALPLSLATLALFASGAAYAFETTQRQGDVTLHYQDASDAVPEGVRTRIIDTFFRAYLPQRADFHPQAAAGVAIVIDPAYDGIAYVGEKAKASTITINPAWLAKHPGDTDLVTHEAMHIVQGYTEYANARVPGWLVEGIADYARDRYGVDNAAAGWALPLTVKEGQTAETGYRVTGAFLKWSEAAHPGLAKALDGALRSGRYTPALWQTHTGHTLPDLWTAYTKAATR